MQATDEPGSVQFLQTINQRTPQRTGRRLKWTNRPAQSCQMSSAMRKDEENC